MKKADAKSRQVAEKNLINSSALIARSEASCSSLCFLLHPTHAAGRARERESAKFAHTARHLTHFRRAGRAHTASTKLRKSESAGHFSGVKNCKENAELPAAPILHPPNGTQLSNGAQKAKTLFPRAKFSSSFK